MRVCLAFVCLVLCTAGCGAIPAPSWPVIWPEWEHDPAEVLDVPPPPGPEPANAELREEDAACLAIRPDEAPNAPPEEPLAGGAEENHPEADSAVPATVPVDAAAAEDAAENDLTADTGNGPAPAAEDEIAATTDDGEPEPGVEEEPAGMDEVAPGGGEAEPPHTVESSGALRSWERVLDAPWFPPASEAGGSVRDLFVKPDSGAVLAVLVADTAGNEHLLEAGALRWTAGPSLELAVVLQPAHARELYAAEDLVDLAGVVTAFEEAGSGARLMVRDEGNLLHRVDVPARKLLERALPTLQVGVAVRLRAAPSRDAEGKVWIPASLSAGDASIALRDQEGAPLWGELCRDLRSARTLIGASIHFTGADWTVAGWTFDPAASRLVSLELAGEGRSASAPWDSLPAGWSW